MDQNQFLTTALRLLENSGFHNLRADSEFIYMEDPACILRSFETFIEQAWFIITFFAGILLLGWAISMIRGAKYDNIFVNLRNLMLIFLGLSFTKPVINFIYGDDLFAHACRTIAVKHVDVKKMLDARSASLKKYDPSQLYEDLVITDTGAVLATETETPKTNDTQQPQESTEIEISEEVNVNDEKPYTDTPTTPEKIVDISSLPVSASESGRDVVYEMSDGTRIKKSGGTRAWRNSNPGNIRYSRFAQNVGAIGQAGGFAVFPDEATGMYAIEALLRTDSYNKLTVAGAITRYAPPVENDTAAYHRSIEKLTGLSINKMMQTLTPAELTSVANAIKQIEGWKTGTTQRI